MGGRPWRGGDTGIMTVSKSPKKPHTTKRQPAAAPSPSPSPAVNIDDIVGVTYDIPKPECYIRGKSWPISPIIGTASGMDAILTAMEKIEAALQAGVNGKIPARQMIKQRDTAVRDALGIAVPTLDYAAESESTETGPYLMSVLAIRLKDFGLAGGAAGALLSQTGPAQGT